MECVRQSKEAALKYFKLHLSPQKPQHPKDSFRFLGLFVCFFKHYSQFQRGSKQEIATRWDILKKKEEKIKRGGGGKAAFYMEALKCIIQAEKVALILYE